MDVSTRCVRLVALLAAPLAAGAVAAGSGAAWAASDTVCQAYADSAVAQHRENGALGCGYGGLRWHDNAAGHFLYCKAVDKASVDEQTRLRDLELKDCAEKANAQQQQQQPQQQNPQAQGGANLGVQDQNLGGAVFDPNKAPLENPQLQLQAASCKARSVSRTAQHESPSEAERLAIAAWEIVVSSSYGAEYGNVSNAKDPGLACRDAGTETECTFSGIPCNG